MSDKNIPETITIQVRGEERRVRAADYVRAKTRDLRDFGYGTLTEHAVEEQLAKILRGDELTVIGHFMKDDIVITKE